MANSQPYTLVEFLSPGGKKLDVEYLGTYRVLMHHILVFGARKEGGHVIATQIVHQYTVEREYSDES